MTKRCLNLDCRKLINVGEYTFAGFCRDCSAKKLNQELRKREVKRGFGTFIMLVLVLIGIWFVFFS